MSPKSVTFVVGFLAAEIQLTRHELKPQSIRAMRQRLGAYLIILAYLCPLAAQAQESTSVFNFLSLPNSAHATALGGRNISLIEDDASLTFQNPSLLSSVSNNTLSLDFLTYMKGCNAGGASYARVAGERGTWGVNAQFVSYGSMTETLERGEIIGDMSALDFAFSGLYSYNLSDRWAAGASGKLIYSKYASYSSFAMAVDLGLNYYDEGHDFSFSVVASNLGGQIKAFGEEHERLPYDLQLGFTKRIAHAPLRISVTMVDINRWSSKYYYSGDGKPSFGRKLMNHFNVGLDIIPVQMVYVAVGYNFRRAYEMKAAGSSHAAGLTLGAGLNIKKFKLGVAYAKYHVSAPSLSLSIAYSL